MTKPVSKETKSAKKVRGGMSIGKLKVTGEVCGDELVLIVESPVENVDTRKSSERLTVRATLPSRDTP